MQYEATLVLLKSFTLVTKMLINWNAWNTKPRTFEGPLQTSYL